MTGGIKVFSADQTGIVGNARIVDEQINIPAYLQSGGDLILRKAGCAVNLLREISGSECLMVP